MMVEKEAVIGYCLVLALDDPLTYPNIFESEGLFLGVLVHPLLGHQQEPFFKHRAL